MQFTERDLQSSELSTPSQQYQPVRRNMAFRLYGGVTALKRIELAYL
jgi:hypothetical protein